MDVRDHGGKRSAGGRRGSRPDVVLLVLVLLLAVTLGAYAAGWTSYPFGILVLVVLIVGRLLARRRPPGGWR